MKSYWRALPRWRRRTAAVLAGLSLFAFAGEALGFAATTDSDGTGIIWGAIFAIGAVAAVRADSGSRRSRPAARRRPAEPVYGYELRTRWPREVTYVGITKDPRRREREHRNDRKHGNLVVVTEPLSRDAARRWEAAQLHAYRLGHSGRNPRHNRTDSG